MGNKMKRVLKAFDNKDLSCVTTLIAQHCLDPNRLIPDKGVTCFHLIIGHQSENFAFKVSKLFLRFGGDPNVPSEDGVTPIHVAAAWGRTRILHLLLVNGGDPWIQDDDRKNAFNYAFEEQEWDAVEMLHHFQQMHSSALHRKDIDQNPKFEFNFERILLRKGEEMFEYALDKDDKKSKKPRDRSEFAEERGISPVSNKIKYFESYPCNWNADRKETEITCEKCSKDHYQTSCEFMVNAEASKSQNERDLPPRGELENEKRFISSIHIDASPLKTQQIICEDSIISMDKPSNESMVKCEDVRSRLFTELQEAVLRRSRLKMHHSKCDKENESERERESENGACKPMGASYSEASILELNLSSKASFACNRNEALQGNSAAEDDFAANEVSCMHGVNLSGNNRLRQMSHSATGVTEEIEVSETEEESEKSNEIREWSRNDGITTTYLTCEEESDFVEDEGKVVKAMSLPGDDAKNNSSLEVSNESFVSVAEEYRYTDPEEGILLLEKKLVLNPTVSEIMEDFGIESERSSMVSDVSSGASAISYASDTIRSELTSFGFNPGPITKTTKKLYLRKLWRLKKANKRISNAKKVFSTELERTLKNEIHFKRILMDAKLEEEMIRMFDECPKRKWREGGSKTSFNYLLLDPRVSLNLPRRAATMADGEVWKCFLSSVFYVGKGKRARPYAHLYEAASSWQKEGDKKNENEKVRLILDIWSEDLGVICLHVFQNVIPVEAYTREAAMIDAIGLANLKNVKSGEYYGSPATWMTRDKLKLGVLLLYKAMLIYLSEGERQIRPYDIA